MNRKAVSPLVATMLLIAFAIALGAVVMNWGRGYIEERAEFVAGTGETGGCLSIKLSIIEVSGAPQVCYSDGVIKMMLQNDGRDVEAIHARIIGDEGISVAETILEETLKSLDSRQASFSYALTVGAIKQIKLTPRIMMSGKLESCPT
jgi:flagellin-like protein